MTSDGISTADWDQVHDLALRIVNAHPDDALSRHYRAELLAFLDVLEAQYGERPSLCATRAEYVSDPRESVRLFQKAYDLAVTIHDNRNALMVALSLVGLYVSALKSRPEAERWLEIAEASREFGSPSDLAELNEMREATRTVAATE